uniref:Methyltransferase type 11 domain-containing protein n=1 Tax=Aegilops tauschii subsp. strangulata TaxID=200361 RepID=A0A453T4C3_AEGTS
FQETKTEQNDTSETEVFACPVCYEPLIRKGPPGMNLPAIYRSGFKCSKCNKSFTSKDVFLDLTVTSGMKEYSELKPARTELFRSPLVSYLYERGWRQNFNRSGFPGRDEEFQMAQDYFQSVAGGILVDVSCGSGLFSRKFASSGAYSSVIALDFSENMLRQCYDYIKQEETPMNTNLALVRADISRLPFASCSIDAIHAGAAIHCWPSPSNAIAEISRVLKPGGVFVATTFLSTPTNSGLFSIDALKPLRQVKGVVERLALLLIFCMAEVTWPDAPYLLCAADCWASEQQLQLLHRRGAGRPVQILWSGQLQQQGSEVIHHVLRAKAIAEYHPDSL